jgi:hypothetical protein
MLVNIAHPTPGNQLGQNQKLINLAELAELTDLIQKTIHRPPTYRPHRKARPANNNFAHPINAGDRSFF